MDEKESGPSDLSWKETRERLVQQALDDGDLGRLRELAALPGGFGSNEMRKKVWPFLLGTERYFKTRPPDAPAQPTPFVDDGDNVDVDNKDRVNDHIPHREEEQVQKDTNRSFVSYPRGLPKEAKTALQADLQNLIVGVLRKYPALSYFQGYHDILSVLYLTYIPLPVARLRSRMSSRASSRSIKLEGPIEDEKQAVEDKDENFSGREKAASHGDTEDWRTLRQCAEVLSLCRVRDAMGTGMQPMMGYLKLLKRVLLVADPEIARFSSLISPVPTLPFFALSWILTLFSHDVDTLEPIQRMFDFLLSRNPISAIYLAVAILVAKKPQMLRLVRELGQEAMDDPSVLHPLFARLPPLLADDPVASPAEVEEKSAPMDSNDRDYDEKNPYDPIPLSTIFNITDDLLARYPWDGSIIRGHEILGSASSVVTYSREEEDDWDLHLAETLVNGEVIQPGADIMEEDEDEEVIPTPTRRHRRSLRLPLRLPRNKMGTLVAVGVVLFGVGIAVYGARSGGPRSDWTRWWSTVMRDWASRSHPHVYRARDIMASWLRSSYRLVCSAVEKVL